MPEDGSQLHVFLPWFIFLAVIFIALKFVKWARKRRSEAIIFVALVHMFLPDHQVAKTVEVVQTQKQMQKKQQDGNDEPYDQRQSTIDK